MTDRSHAVAVNRSIGAPLDDHDEYQELDLFMTMRGELLEKIGSRTFLVGPNFHGYSVTVKHDDDTETTTHYATLVAKTTNFRGEQ